MKTSIATVSLSGTLGEKLEAIAAAKFDAVEIFENDLVTFNGTPADVRRACQDLGLDIVTLQPFRDFEGMPDGPRARAFARAERKFDVMQELGCDLLMICSNVSPESLGGIDRAAADLHELGKRAAKRGLRIAFEALAWGRHINDYRDSWEAVRRADHPAVGLVLDTFHILARRTDLGVLRAIPKDRIFLVQVADAPVLQMDYLSWSRHYRNFPGQGDLPLVDFMQALSVTGYDGPLSLEIFNDQFRAGSARSVAVDGHRSLRFLQDQLKPKLPPRSTVGGTAFVEFALDDTAAQGFERMLAGMGFRRAGRHKSKAVTRWQQGNINLVVNREKEGFAHSFNIVHGSAVCALGLKVNDAAATFERATLLLDQPFHQSVGPGELDIPAVRGVGGSLVYFLDDAGPLARVWEIEFDDPGDTADGAGLTRVDHIAQSMQYEEMLSWVLFYTSLLDLQKVPPQDVPDPGGLVVSQVIEAADGALRLVLNASQSHRTQSSRFLAEAFGSGVQHLALATDDMMRTATRLEQNGIELLEIPENYYDDLEAKTGLPPERIAELKAHNILSTATVRPNICRSICGRSSSSSSRLSTEATIAATVPPTHRCGWRHRQDSPQPRETDGETDMALRISIVNGPNLNLLGVREPHIYGSTTLDAIEKSCRDFAGFLGVELDFSQSNHEGAMVDTIQAARGKSQALIINPAAYSFTSVALFDVLKTFEGPIVEVHISNIHARDELHRHSKLSAAATSVICGLGPYGYIVAMQAAVRTLGKLPASLPAPMAVGPV